jgi:HTH-type transcriptional regulator / antitoxin HipB
MPYRAYLVFMHFKACIDIMPLKAYIAGMQYGVQKPSQLALHLRSLRRARGLTQAELGTRVGLDQTRIAKIERDPLLVSVGQLLQLLSALEVQVVLLGSRDLGQPEKKQERRGGGKTKSRPRSDGAEW